MVYFLYALIFDNKLYKLFHANLSLRLYFSFFTLLLNEIYLKEVSNLFLLENNLERNCGVAKIFSIFTDIFQEILEYLWNC